MPKASDLKRGMIVEINDVPHIAKQIDVKSPSSRGSNTLYKVRFNNLKTGQKLDESYKGDDFLKDSDCQRCEVQYSYFDGDNYVFMNTEDYSQYSLNADDLEGQLEFLTDGLSGITALILGGNAIAIELPQSVSVTIVETVPCIKGASATGRTKPARLNTGLEVQVPEYLSEGEVIKVNTATNKFMSRT